ncbi:MAG TPA: hydrogenase maturation nickel metallochaperone HypA [Dongiaceae bacterium]|nr:hydrogenase maturation nickel metallochaperone HypA [Dongiaceae bacterium]
MHELALMESIVAAVEERIQPARAARVRLQIGRLAGVMPDALRFCFDVCTQGTHLEGAALEIDEIRGRATCRRCGREVEMESFLDACPCGSVDVDLVAGQEVRVKEVEVQ